MIDSPNASMGLYGSPERIRELMVASRDWPSLTLTAPQIASLELLLDGAFAPLTGFMTRDAVDACLRGWRLPGGALWPVPVTLDVSGAADGAQPGARVMLRDAEGSPLAVLDVSDRWPADGPGLVHLGGRVEGVAPLRRYEFAHLRVPTAAIRAAIAERRWNSVIAVQTDRVLHHAEVEHIRHVAEQMGAGVLLQAIVEPGAANEDLQYRRVRRLEGAADALGPQRAMVTLLPLALERTGVRGAVLLALIARNYGCSHVAVALALPTDAAAGGIQRRELGIEPLDPAAVLGVSSEADAETDARPRHEQGFTVFFTGLSGSGKSTIANALRVRLLEQGGRRVTLLDGDVVRQHLSSELGFSREHRELNIRRIGFVASEITKHGGIAVCAPIAPYDATRREVRRAIEAVGGFVLVFVDTPLELCERRDPKGLYARARAGIIPEFTGVTDPYEPPADADLVIRTSEIDADTAATRIVEFLKRAGYLREPAPAV